MFMCLCFFELSSGFFLLDRLGRKTDWHILFRSMFSSFFMYLGLLRVAYLFIGLLHGQNFVHVFEVWIPTHSVPESIVASTIPRHQFTVKKSRNEIGSEFFFQLPCRTQQIISKINVGINSKYFFLQGPKTVDKVPFKLKKSPSLSANLSRLLNSAPLQTSNTWRKLSVSAFQQCMGLGVSDRVYEGKSTILHVDTNGGQNPGIGR